MPTAPLTKQQHPCARQCYSQLTQPPLQPRTRPNSLLLANKNQFNHDHTYDDHDQDDVTVSRTSTRSTSPTSGTSSPTLTQTTSQTFTPTTTATATLTATTTPTSSHHVVYNQQVYHAQHDAHDVS